MATVEEKKVGFPNDMGSASEIKGNDYFMLADGDTKQTKSATWNKAKDYLTITGQSLDPIPSGALPTPEAGQVRTMEVVGPDANPDGSPATSTWTHATLPGGSASLVTGKIGVFYFNGSTWALRNVRDMPKTNAVNEYGTSQTAPMSQAKVTELRDRVDQVEAEIPETVASLTSTDDEKTLAASQGKILNDKKADETNTTGKVLRSPAQTSSQYTNVPGTLATGGFYRRDTGALVNDSGWKNYSFPIPETIGDNEKFLLSGPIDGSTQIAVALFYGATGNYLGFQEAVTSGTVTKNRAELTLPAGTRQIRSSNRSSSGAITIEKQTDTTTYKNAMLEGDAYPKADSFSKTEINAIVSDQDAAIADKASEEDANGKVVRAEKVTTEQYIPIEPTNFGSASGFYRYDTGAVTASTTRRRYKFPYDHTKDNFLTGQINGAAQVAIAVFFDAYDNYLGYFQRVRSANDSAVTTDPKGDVDYVRKKIEGAPANTAWFGTGNIETRGDIVVEYLEVTEEYKEALFVGDVYDKEQVDEMVYNPLRGKTITDFGDSIMQGNQNNNIGPINIIGSRNGMTIQKYSLGGATVAVKSTNQNDIVRQVNNAVADGIDTDYIIMDGLTNDISNLIPLGVMTAGYTDALDNTTFSGALEYIFKTIKATWPNAKVLYTRVHKMASRGSAEQESYGQRAIDICKKWSIAVCDIYNEGSLNTYLVNMTQMYTTPTGAQPDGDRTHPNQLGYEMFYVPMQESRLKSL